MIYTIYKAETVLCLNSLTCCKAAIVSAMAEFQVSELAGHLTVVKRRWQGWACYFNLLRLMICCYVIRYDKSHISGTRGCMTHSLLAGGFWRQIIPLVFKMTFLVSSVALNLCKKWDFLSKWELQEGWRKLPNEKLHDLLFSVNMLRSVWSLFFFSVVILVKLVYLFYFVWWMFYFLREIRDNRWSVAQTCQQSSCTRLIHKVSSPGAVYRNKT
jgi:hypothetical protein